jgi:hypothetical protein
MGEKKTTPITIDNKEYTLEDMTQEQRLLVDHCLDLDRKIASTQFNLDQLRVGKDAFVSMLKTALEKPAETTEVVQ